MTSPLAAGEYRAGIDAALTPIPEAKPDAFEPDDSAFEAPLVKPDGESAFIASGHDTTTIGSSSRSRPATCTRQDMRVWATTGSMRRLEFLDGDGGRADRRSQLSRGARWLRVRSCVVIPRQVDRYNCWYDLSISEEVPASVSGTVQGGRYGRAASGCMSDLMSYQTDVRRRMVGLGRQQSDRCFRAVRVRWCVAFEGVTASTSSMGTPRLRVRVLR